VLCSCVFFLAVSVVVFLLRLFSFFFCSIPFHIVLVSQFTFFFFLLLFLFCCSCFSMFLSSSVLCFLRVSCVVFRSVFLLFTLLHLFSFIPFSSTKKNEKKILSISHFIFSLF
jgi:hypothetical protein